jgi:hypothetical protein
MLDERKKAPMRRVLPYCLVLLAFGFVLTAPITNALAAASETDFITMYKGFFQDLQGKKYQQVWDAMTAASKQEIAKQLAAAFVAAKKETTQAEVFDMLEKNTDGLRNKYFDNLHAEFEKLSFFTQVTAAQYAIKSSTKERVVVTITLANEPKDFQILREGGKWKINFLYDLSH